jgi:hypothetical protein
MAGAQAAQGRGSTRVKWAGHTLHPAATPTTPLVSVSRRWTAWGHVCMNEMITLACNTKIFFYITDPMRWTLLQYMVRMENCLREKRIFKNIKRLLNLVLYSIITLYGKFETYIPRYETAQPRSQFLNWCSCERFIYISLSDCMNVEIGRQKIIILFWK